MPNLRQISLMKMKGRVIKSTGSWYKVALNNQNSVNARLKGNLRLMGSRSTNPIAVGDFVDLIPESEGNFLIQKNQQENEENSSCSSNISVKIIDWEWAGPGDRFCDVGIFCSFCSLTEQEEYTVLYKYSL